jgi:hypothetical protein
MIDHEAIDELLAGYVLRSLTGEDAETADRLLTDHVPDCTDCLATLDAFQGLTGDIALVAAPVTVPDTVLPRLHRSLDGRRSRRMPTWHPGRLVAAAAAVVAVIGVAGLAITQVGGDAGSQRLTQADLQHINEVASLPDAEVTDLGYADEVTAPGLEEIYLRGSGVPSPPDGSTYRLWPARSRERPDSPRPGRPRANSTRRPSRRRHPVRPPASRHAGTPRTSRRSRSRASR